MATGDSRYADVARDTFYNILRRSENPKGHYSKQVSGTRPLEGFSLPMILCNLVMEIETLLPPELFSRTIAGGIDTVMNKFYQPDLGLILENILPDGTRARCCCR
jgi:N-acylglucosamine 2-epimerase